MKGSARQLPLTFLLFLTPPLCPIGDVLAQQRTVNVEGPLTLRTVQGRVETLADDATWRPLTSSEGRVERALRTGTGRVVLMNGTGGRTLVGSASRLRQYSNEPDFQSGQFLLEGPAAAFALGSHLVIENRGKARVDISPDGSTRRVAVLEGQLRVSNGNRTFTLTPGRQLLLDSLQQAAFTESDPWYASMFSGQGDATVEALRGTVRLLSSEGSAQGARAGQTLGEAQTLTTADHSWVEVGFTGGGYLRLAEQSELKVLAVEKTSRGREVTLQLVKGSAWNVVQKGQGGYKISTPVVSTAVRGTKFRVDASGLVKVMEGSVALPSEGDLQLGADQQKMPQQPVQALQKDALDLFNEALDMQRARPLELHWTTFARHQQKPEFELRGSPDALITAGLSGQGSQAISIPVKADMPAGIYQLAPQGVPEGRYVLNVRAVRFGQTQRWSRVLWIDHTAPSMSQVQRLTRGRVTVLSGQVSDTAGHPLTLHLKGQGVEVTRTVEANAPFQMLLPPDFSRGPLQLELTDAAGNRTHALLD